MTHFHQSIELSVFQLSGGKSDIGWSCVRKFTDHNEYLRDNKISELTGKRSKYRTQISKYTNLP